MNITLVLAVYNNLDLTKNCYKYIRKIYPTAPLVISVDYNDGTLEWLEEISDVDDFLSFVHETERISFSDNYNQAIKIVDTDKLVLIHNDMVITEGFLETLDAMSDEKTLLCYTTIEPPVFNEHVRAGKMILDCGGDFNDFNEEKLKEFLDVREKTNHVYDGGSFFMSGYKDLFIDVDYFDGKTFSPYFCEDDDFLIRTKLKGYKLKTTEDAIVYHFVSKTSRFSDESKYITNQIEVNSNRNFIRKWGVSNSFFHMMEYWNVDPLIYQKKRMGITLKTCDINTLKVIEPYFDTIILDDPKNYIDLEQPSTNFNLSEKFNSNNDVDVMVYSEGIIDDTDLWIIGSLQHVSSNNTNGKYRGNNLLIEVK